MKSERTLELKVVPIGNSRGIRLPRFLISKYLIRDAVLVEQRAEGLLLRGTKDKRLSWEETYREMAKESEDWADFEGATADGLDSEPW
jgi:antitoxin MazE